VRVVAALEDDGVELLAVPDPLHRSGEAARAGVGVEGRSIAPEEDAPDGGRVDPTGLQVGVRDARGRIALDFREQGRQPLRPVVRPQGTAALAGPVAGGQGVLGGRKKFERNII
jgi:hypothetical protein